MSAIAHFSISVSSIMATTDTGQPPGLRTVCQDPLDASLGCKGLFPLKSRPGLCVQCMELENLAREGKGPGDAKYDRILVSWLAFSTAARAEVLCAGFFSMPTMWHYHGSCTCSFGGSRLALWYMRST